MENHKHHVSETSEAWTKYCSRVWWMRLADASSAGKSRRFPWNMRGRGPAVFVPGFQCKSEVVWSRTFRGNKTSAEKLQEESHRTWMTLPHFEVVPFSFNQMTLFCLQLNLRISGTQSFLAALKSLSSPRLGIHISLCCGPRFAHQKCKSEHLFSINKASEMTFNYWGPKCVSVALSLPIEASKSYLTPLFNNRSFIS